MLALRLPIMFNQVMDGEIIFGSSHWNVVVLEKMVCASARI